MPLPTQEIFGWLFLGKQIQYTYGIESIFKNELKRYEWKRRKFQFEKNTIGEKIHCIFGVVSSYH